jgi:hypothetical protein
LVVQLYFLGNGSDRTYIGAPAEGLDLPATVAVHVPAEVQEVVFENGVVGGRFQQVGDLYYDTSPLIPGEGTKQIVVRYLLPYEGTSITYSQRFLYPTTQINLLVAELPQLQATITPADAAPLEAVESQEFEGRTYRIYQAGPLPPTEVEVALNGLMAAGTADPRAEAGVTPIPTETFASWMGWSIAGLGVLMIAGGVAWAWRSGRVRVADQEEEMRQEVNDLAKRIAQLDDRHALGQLNNESWQQQRSLLKARLLEVSLRLQNSAVE